MPDYLSGYSARFNGPHLIVKGLAGTMLCPIWKDGAAFPVTAGSVKVYRPSGTEFAGGTTAIVAGAISWSYDATEFDDEDAAEGWVFEWTITISGDYKIVARNDAAVVFRELFPVITDIDLYRRHKDLDPSVAGSIAGTNSDYQDYIDEAWRTIQDKLIANGRRPWLAMSPTAFRQVHLYMTLELIFRDFATSMGDGAKYHDLSIIYNDMAKDAWPALTYLEDTDNDGKLDSNQRRASAVSTIWLNGRLGRPQ
jgi:hypothetical protein